MSGRGEPDEAPLAALRVGRRAVLAGLLVLLEHPAQAAEAPQTLVIALTEYRFIPDHPVLRHGVAYRLVLNNIGAEIHEFTAPAFFGAIKLENPDILDASGKQIVIRPGERRTLRFVAPPPGRYPFACADHDWAGMVGEIQVR